MQIYDRHILEEKGTARAVALQQGTADPPFQGEETPPGRTGVRGFWNSCAVIKKHTMASYIDPAPISETLEQLWIVVEIPQKNTNFRCSLPDVSSPDVTN